MIKENSGIRKTDIINRRMFIIGAAKIVVFSGIIARLFSLQINENKKYLTLSDKNRIREWNCHLPEEILLIILQCNCGKFKSLSVAYNPWTSRNFNYLLSRLKILLQLSDKKISKMLN